ncbi:MAG TPA: hypothetical protein VH062_24545 [Polyangiaceae bacterium]|jgi:hypothetical protein|nr:hypothetical protein [Polyangiaceae bacterium]
MTSLARDTRGAVYVEYLIACVPVVAFFVATWQFIELATADLVLKRAASAAARAAIVILPDDPSFYGGDEGKAAKGKGGALSGKKAEDITLAANLILGTMNVPPFPSQFSPATVTFPDFKEGMERGAPLTAVVTTSFNCGMGWASIVCGGSSRTLTARATYAYQGAEYGYE